MDWRRCFAMTAFGGLYTGVASLHIYALYPRLLPSFIGASPTRRGFACSALDNFVHVPFLYTPFFYFFTGLLKGDGWDETMRTLEKCAMPSISACWIMWIPYQAINFSIVPTKHRVVFMQVGNVIWNIILDFIANNTKDPVDTAVTREHPKAELGRSQGGPTAEAVGWAWSAEKVDPLGQSSTSETLRKGEGGP